MGEDDMYYASIDEAHDGLWLYSGLNGMMHDFDDTDNFIADQEEDWLEDLEMKPELKREEEFFTLEKDSMAELVAELRDKGLRLACGVLRRVLEDNPFPPCLRVTRFDDSEMSDLIAKKQEGNKLFLQKKYKEAVEIYDDALLCICHRHPFISPVVQMKEIVNVLSNKVECHIRLRDYDEACEIATEALIIDSDHTKTRIRRAKAEIALYKEEKKLICLAQADRDIKEVTSNCLSDVSAIKAAQSLYHKEIKVYLTQERKKTAKENPKINFDIMLRVLQSSCW